MEFLKENQLDINKELLIQMEGLIETNLFLTTHSIINVIFLPGQVIGMGLWLPPEVLANSRRAEKADSTLGKLLAEWLLM